MQHNNNNNNVLSYKEVEYYDDEYIFYQEGNIPVIITFPHSGRLKIDDIPIRKTGCIDPDWFTQELAISMIQCFNCVYCCCGCNDSSGCNNNNNNNNSDSSSSSSGNNNNNCDSSDNSCSSIKCCSSESSKKKDNNSNNSKCTCCNINFDNNIVEYKRECLRPYIVYSKIHRELVDFNRKEDNAFEDERMRVHHQLYHNTIKKFIGLVKERHAESYEQGKVVLLDIHGQSDLKDYILRGTKDTKTVELLLNNIGRDSVIGDNSILGYLVKNGVKVFPNNLPSDYTLDSNSSSFIKPEDEIPEIKLLKSFQYPKSYYYEHPEFTGAYTVVYYSKEYSINTIQVEVGYKWRSTKEYRIEVSRLLRSSILNFLSSYNIK